MAVFNDEPTQLIRYLVMAAQEHIGFSEHDIEWKVLFGHFTAAQRELEKLNEPARRS